MLTFKVMKTAEIVIEFSFASHRLESPFKFNTTNYTFEKNHYKYKI